MKSRLLISSDFRPRPDKVASADPVRYCSTKIPVFVTRSLPSSDSDDNDKEVCDSNGDALDLPRPDFFVSVRFAAETDLSCVGLQVWVPSLVLCDHLVALLSGPCSLFPDGTVFLELGCGVGLPSLVLCKAMYYKSMQRTIFMTDVKGPVLDNARLAAERTCRDIRGRKGMRVGTAAANNSIDLRVRELDWMSALSKTSFRKWRPELLACGWTTGDVAVLEAAVCSGKLVVLAADPVYDETLTECLVGVLCELSEAAPKLEILLSLEKRVNFLVGDSEPRAIHYDHFWNELRGRCTTLAWEKLTVHEPPLHVSYQRNSNIELWRICKTKKRICKG